MVHMYYLICISNIMQNEGEQIVYMCWTWGSSSVGMTRYLPSLLLCDTSDVKTAQTYRNQHINRCTHVYMYILAIYTYMYLKTIHTFMMEEKVSLRASDVASFLRASLLRPSRNPITLSCLRILHAQVIAKCSIYKPLCPVEAHEHVHDSRGLWTCTRQYGLCFGRA